MSSADLPIKPAGHRSSRDLLALVITSGIFRCRIGRAVTVLEVKLSGTKGGDPRYWKGKVSGRKISDHVHVPMLGIDQDRPTVDSGDALIIPPAVDFIGREIISDSSWKIN